MWIFPETSDKRQQHNKVFLLFMYFKKLIIKLEKTKKNGLSGFYETQYFTLIIWDHINFFL